MEKVLVWIIAIVLGAAYIGVTFGLSAVLSGLVLVQLWKWFVLPLGALPALTTVQAVGLSLTLRFLVNGTDMKKDEEDTEKEPIKYLARVFLKAVLHPVMVLLFGWIITLFR